MGRTNRKRKAVVLCAAWGLLLVQGFALPALGQDPSDGNEPVSSNMARVVVTSSPTGQTIILDGHRLDATTPAEVEVHPGRVHLTVNAEGYQPLSHEMTVVVGDHLELNFILLKTPPMPPTPEELRALAPPFGADDPDSRYWAEAGPRQMANESCRDCHPSILNLHAQGEHRTLSCEDCHSKLSEHVQDDKVTGVMFVISGEGIQPLCMTCHDRNNRNRTRDPARTVVLPGHLRDLRVRDENRCEDCHHVHDPMKWVHEAREMVGVPEKMASIPMMDEKLAYEKQEGFNSYAETFLVFPLVPGFLGMVAFSDSDEFPAEELFYSGLALVAVSYILGKMAYSRELTHIRDINQERTASNLQVKEYNLKVKKAMSDYHTAIILWESESQGRGVVVVP